MKNEKWQLYRAEQLVHVVQADVDHGITIFKTVHTSKTKGGKIISEQDEDVEIGRLEASQLKVLRSQVLFSIWGDFEATGDVDIAERIIFSPDLEG